MEEVIIHGAILLGVLYLFLLIGFRLGLMVLHPGSCAENPKVSVIVPAHNESANIDSCLLALSVQDYPLHLTEIVVVNDRSADDTPTRVLDWKDRFENLVLVSVSDSNYICPKKNALMQGIESSSGDLILTTDADCIPSASWISSTVRCFSPEIGMVIGYAPLQAGKGLLQKLLSLQGIVVAGLAAGSAGIGFPLACSGRNLAYRRSAFCEIEGFEPIGHIVGGDDVLLMRQMAENSSWRICFNPDRNASVTSVPHRTGRFGRQIRYQSKAIHYGIPILILAVGVYIFHLTLLATPLLAWLYPGIWAPMIALMAGKMLVDGIFLWHVTKCLGGRRQLVWFPILELVSVPYTVLFCALGLFKSLRWT